MSLKSDVIQCWSYVSLLQEADREIHELLAWMRQDEGLSDDEEADMLMALAEQAGPTPRSQSQRSSQQVKCSVSDHYFVAWPPCHLSQMECMLCQNYASSAGVQPI